jgi:hypothetical protein
MIGFFCTSHLPNYTTNPEAYAYLQGKVSSTAYYYYILQNNNIKNIALINNLNDIEKCDAIVFHYDDYEYLKNYKGKLIQVVTDRPYIKNIDAYICCNEFILAPKLTLELCKIYPFDSLLFKFIDEKWFFIHYPPTFNIKKCTPSFPPVNFKFVGRKHTLQKSILDEDNIKTIEKSLNIKLIFDFENDYNMGNEDVYFCIRNINRISKITKEIPTFGINGNKTPNRLYQAWYMNTPSIFNISPEMINLKKNDFDCTFANNFDEFYIACEKLVKNEDFFYKSVERCKEKSDKDNPYCNLNLIVEQWKKVFDFLNFSY